MTSLPFCAARGRVLHQHRVGAGAVYLVILIASTCRVVGRRAQHLDHRGETLEGVVEQDVAAADRGEDLAAFVEHLGQAGHEGCTYPRSGARPVRDLHEAHQVPDAGRAVEVVGGEWKCCGRKPAISSEQLSGDLQAHRVAEVTLLQLALRRGAQILTSSSSTNRSGCA